MKIGITGHRLREDIDWDWVSDEVTMQLIALNTDLEGFSSLAEGADQIFADAILSLNGQVNAVIPFDGYEKTITDDKSKNRYFEICQNSNIIKTRCYGTVEDCYLAAGMFIADSVELIFAVWDGQEAAGKGGTADIVAYAMKKNLHIIHINTSTKLVNILGRA